MPARSQQTLEIGEGPYEASPAREIIAIGVPDLAAARLFGEKDRPYRDCMQHAERRLSEGAVDDGAMAALRQRLLAVFAFSRYALHRFSRDGCFAAAGALSYTTLVSLVPLGVIALGILSAFPDFAAIRQELLALVFRNFVPQISEQAAWWFQYFAESAAQATAIGIVGIAATGVLLLATVEDQLDRKSTRLNSSHSS